MPTQGPPNLVPSADCLAIAQRNQQQSPLLRLPAELRTRIYGFTMDIKIGKVVHDDYPTWDRLTFSRTSRQIFAETALPYFKAKLLPLRNPHGCSFDGPKNWQETMAKLTPSQKRYIKKVVVSWQQMREMFRAQINPLLSALPHLRVLEVESQGDYRFGSPYDYEDGDWDEKMWNLVFSTKISAQFLAENKPDEALDLY